MNPLARIGRYFASLDSGARMAWIYNVSVLAGVSMTGVGVGAAAGWPIGLATAGVLVIALSVFGVLVSRSAG